ncbi:uncharacterized protein LOC129743467 [Uranotaenia lowii]|uniref:uncharacterized protein LOC129743467 n=1 Tax=Uranotaenia lowii TaxID=190385 RepID=UPI0024789E54|nr:uncharacterized protein LOC129743467 [Uranotaenia lowii]
MTTASGSWFQWASDQGSFWEAASRHGNISRPIGPLIMMNEDGSDYGSDFVFFRRVFSSGFLAMLTGSLLILFLRHKMSRYKDEISDSKDYNSPKIPNMKDTRQSLFVFYAFIKFTILLPIFLAGYLCFKLYRCFVSIELRRRHGSHFKGLLDGADVVWAIESDNSRGMINIMAYIEESAVGLETNNEFSTSAELLLVLRKRISSRLMGNIQPYQKMFWKRNLDQCDRDSGAAEGAYLVRFSN